MSGRHRLRDKMPSAIDWLLPAWANGDWFFHRTWIKPLSVYRHHGPPAHAHEVCTRAIKQSGGDVHHHRLCGAAGAWIGSPPAYVISGGFHFVRAFRWAARSAQAWHMDGFPFGRAILTDFGLSRPQDIQVNRGSFIAVLSPSVSCGRGVCSCPGGRLRTGRQAAVAATGAGSPRPRCPFARSRSGRLAPIPP